MSTFQDRYNRHQQTRGNAVSYRMPTKQHETLLPS